MQAFSFTYSVCKNCGCSDRLLLKHVQVQLSTEWLFSPQKQQWKKCLSFPPRTVKMLKISSLVFFKSLLNMLRSSRHYFLLISCLAIYILPYLKCMHLAAEIAILCLCTHMCVHVCAHVCAQCFLWLLGRNSSANINYRIALWDKIIRPVCSASTIDPWPAVAAF